MYQRRFRAILLNSLRVYLEAARTYATLAKYSQSAFEGMHYDREYAYAIEQAKEHLYKIRKERIRNGN